jgi:Swt1-like HEPN
MKRGAGEIYYTDFGDLASLIRNNWEDFEDLFPDVNWVITRFSELEASRNIVAHNNSLDKNEVDRIKIYLVDWLRQVG